jgi:hypothetical protein
MTSYGVLMFTFDQAMKMPDNQRRLRQIDRSVLDVTILPEAASNI